MFVTSYLPPKPPQPGWMPLVGIAVSTGFGEVSGQVLEVGEDGLGKCAGEMGETREDIGVLKGKGWSGRGGRVR